MSLSMRRPLAVALTAALGLITLAPLVHADPQSSAREERARRQAESGHGKTSKAEAEKKPPLYPNATRQSPEIKASPKTIKSLQAMQDL